MKMYVGSGAVEASDGKTQNIINPATGEVVDTVPAATLQDVDKAISTAVAYQDDWT